MASSGSSHHGSSPSGGNGGRDFIADLDNNKRHEEEWSWSIIGAMAKIQTQYSVEIGLDRDLPKDYFTDSDKLKFFWSGFSNSTATKHIMDILFRSIINFEMLAILLCSIFVQVFVFSNMDEKNYIELTVFLGSYFSVICYSVYITRHYKYFIFGDLSSRMMFFLMVGRLVFLMLSATVISNILYWLAKYFYANPKDLYWWTSKVYWLFDFVGYATSYLHGKEELFWVVYKNVLPEIVDTANEMMYVFLLFGLSPFVILIISKSIRRLRISNEKKQFDRGEL